MIQKISMVKCGQQLPTIIQKFDGSTLNKNLNKPFCRLLPCRAFVLLSLACLCKRAYLFNQSPTAHLLRGTTDRRHKPKKQFYSAIKVIAPCSQVLTHFLHPIHASGLTTLACLWIPSMLILPRTCCLHPSMHLKHAWHLCGSRSINFVLCGLPGLKLNSFIRVAN